VVDFGKAAQSVRLTLACLIGLLGFFGLLMWAEGAVVDKDQVASPSAAIERSTPPAQLLLAHEQRAAGMDRLSRTVIPTRAAGTAAIFTTSVVLATYPYADCLFPPQIGVSGVPYQALDWGCLSAAGPPVSQTYRLLVLSNDYLTVTLLPELGGRIYEMIFKPTGHNELYRNSVLKPAPFGPLEQGWWLAAGGLEWGFPTDEHGYEWGIPWGYAVVHGASGVTVTLHDSDTVTRPTVAVSVHLPDDRAALVVQPQIANLTAAAVGVKYWTNGMLAPGAANSPSADLHFLFPGDQVLVHSTGDADLPPTGALMEWPLHKGLDYSRLGNWDQWLGFFEAPEAHGPFAGVYDSSADEGVLRIYPSSVARGSKGFGFGWADPLPSTQWTDDGSAYVEVHGGLAPTFWDTVTLLAGQVVSWTEVWYPLAGVGGVNAATDEAALRLERVGEALALGLYTPAAHHDVQLYLWGKGCASLGHWHLPQVDPFHPFAGAFPAAGLTPDGLSFVALSTDGMLLGGVNPLDCLPPVATVKPLPFYVTAANFVVTWHGDDAWSGIAEYDVQYRVGYEGDWVDWLTGTLAISATFTGVQGQTYFFRARARDNVGNAGQYSSEEWGQAFTSVLLTPAPVLVTSRKLVAPQAPALNQSVAYTVLISNTGNLTATSLALTDYVPATLVLVSGSVMADGVGLPDPSGGVLTWQGSLAPEREFRFSFALTATSATSVGVPLANSVWLVADGLPRLVRRAAIMYRLDVYLPLVVKDLILP